MGIFFALVFIVYRVGVVYVYSPVEGDRDNQEDFPVPNVSQNETSGAKQGEEQEKPPLFAESFDSDFSIEESNTPENAKNSNWWLSSGGIFSINQGIGQTLHGELPRLSFWRLAYALSNPVDTDQGSHPQNIFRLVIKKKVRDYSQTLHFKIDGYNLSKSKNRNETNGVFLMGRYQDKNNVYYAGVRVDGAAVVKKKINGEYYTIGYTQIFEGEYDRERNPSLLPKNEWIGLRVDIETISDKSVFITLFIDKENDGNWQKVLTAQDDGERYGGASFMEAGYAGIRTDFMDVSFDDYKIVTLP